jgi:hypothetical protein
VTGREWVGAGSGQGLQTGWCVARVVALTLGDSLGGTASGAEVEERRETPGSLQEGEGDGVDDGAAESERVSACGWRGEWFKPKYLSLYLSQNLSIYLRFPSLSVSLFTLC